MKRGSWTIIVILAFASIGLALLYPTFSHLFGWNNLQITAFVFVTASIFFASMFATTLVMTNILEDMPRPVHRIKETAISRKDDGSYLVDQATSYLLLANQAQNILDQWQGSEFELIQLASFTDDVRQSSQKILAWWCDPIAIHHKYDTPAQRELAEAICQGWIALLQQTNNPTTDVSLPGMEVLSPLTTGVIQETDARTLS